MIDNRAFRIFILFFQKNTNYIFKIVISKNGFSRLVTKNKNIKQKPKPIDSVKVRFEPGSSRAGSAVLGLSY